MHFSTYGAATIFFYVVTAAEAADIVDRGHFIFILWQKSCKKTLHKDGLHFLTHDSLSFVTSAGAADVVDREGGHHLLAECSDFDPRRSESGGVSLEQEQDNH